ncbi:MAG: DUF1987 domain-containing protein [Bacteroidetes bacterium]|nr:DUF1987 domain-containing protein [Bacteroidota bacterium]
MKPLFLKESEVLPAISLNPEIHFFEIKGKSIASDGNLFYNQVLHWLEEYCQNPNNQTTFNFRLEFFNIYSSKMLLSIIYKLNNLKAAGHDVIINWYYKFDDDDMLEAGEDYAFMVDVPFIFIRESNLEDEVFSAIVND